MICKKCGFDCKDGMIFCPNCGTELKNEPEDAAEPAPAEDTASAEIAPESISPQPGPQDPVPQPRPQYPTPQPQYPTPQPQYTNPQPPYPQYSYPQQQPRPQYSNPQQPNAPMYGQPAYPYGQTPQARYAPYSSGAYAAPNAGSAVHRALKEVGSSPVMLIAAILLAVAVLLGIVSQIADSAGTNSVLGNIYDGLGGFDDFGDFDDFVDEFGNLGPMFSVDPTVSAVTAVISAIPNILIVIGVFVVFASAKSRTSNTLGTGGLTLINVIIGITLGVICLAALLIIIILIIGVAVLSGGATSIIGGGDYVYALLAVAVILPFIVFAIVISYYICLMRAVGAAKKTALTGVPEVRGSVMYVAVLDFIIGASTAFGSVSNIMSAIVGNPMSIIAALASICSGTAIIMFGVALVNYRSRMKSVSTASPAAAAYQQPQFTVCSRCGAQYMANLPACPRCGMPKNMYR